MAQANPYPLRIDRAIMEKFKVIASKQGRSVNKEIEQLMIQHIEMWEKVHGPILSDAAKQP